MERLGFMFSVGVECSNPITTDGSRVDQLELTGHYEHYKRDLELARDVGAGYVRYGLPIHRVWVGRGEYEWGFADAALGHMRGLGLEPILDLVHFGLPDWLGDFQNDLWPVHFAEYAAAVAERYPWVRLYTPVNEIYVTAQFSARFGWWNERLRSEGAFVNNLKHCVRASILAMRAVLEINPAAVFVFSESTEYVHPGSPKLVDLAHFLNERRFLSLDLLLGHDVSAKVYTYLLDAGMTREEYLWFQGHRDLRSHCVMGTDYYITNEHVLRGNGSTAGSGEVYGYYVITRQYHDRYGLPVMHTETNRTAGQAKLWLWKQWMNLLRLREDGVPMIGFTWYGLLDMIDWDSALTKRRGQVNKVGLFGLDRKPRKVAAEYRRLVADYGHLKIGQSKLPVLTP